jgi:hypothetical protein
MMMMMMMMRGWKLYVRFWVDEYEANNEERENCGVFHVKDTHISIHTYISFEKTLCASLLCDYVRKRTQKRQRFCSPLTKATRRQNRSLSLFLCFFVCVFAGRASRRTSQLSGGGGGVPVRVGVAKLFVPRRTPVFVQIL